MRCRDVPKRIDVLMFSAAAAAIMHCYSDGQGRHRDVFRSKYLNVLDFVFGNTGMSLLPLFTDACVYRLEQKPAALPVSSDVWHIAWCASYRRHLDQGGTSCTCPLAGVQQTQASMCNYDYLAHVWLSTAFCNQSHQVSHKAVQ